MAGYQPLKITGNATGLVKEREEFILPDDAYPVLQNAYVWRERIKRKQGYQLLGRLQRNFTASSLGNSPASATWTFIIYTTIIPAIPQTSPSIVAGSVIITDGTDTFTDQGNGTLKRQDNDVTSTINYITGSVTLNRTVALANAFTITMSYNPNLPVMGIRIRDNQNSNIDQTVFFDTTYAYNYNGTLNSFEEFLPGANSTWTGQDFEFFWTTNYWVGDGNRKIFWTTNFSNSGDPIRYTTGQAGTNWQNFRPIIDAAGDTLNQCLALLPFRGRLVAFNTIESTGSYSNRIRWAAIGTPFTTSDGQIVTLNLNPDAWKDDIRGQGGFLDIPTSEDIVSVGFVRDNLVIYCERSTWQLRYTGRTIAPFQIERVNSEIGALSAFGSIQFDTSLLAVGDKGIIECDSYKSERIDIKIPDYVFQIQSLNNGQDRIQGARDFINRLAYWTIPTASANGTYPDQRLVYNYENDSWALFSDSLTALGTFQVPSSRTWLNTHIPWIQCNFPWINQPSSDPSIVGGNQQGFVEYLDEQTTNDPSLYISAITSHTTTPTVITSPKHNLQTGQVIKISGIPTGTPFATSLNGNVFSIIVIDSNTFQLMVYNSKDLQFSTPKLDTETGYVGGGIISVRDNFVIQSKKFNFVDEGQSIQLGYIDILMDATESNNPGAISLNVYLDYNVDEASNTLPKNIINDGTTASVPDDFFNQLIPTVNSNLNKKGGTKFWQRVFCSTRANFITLEYTFSNAQMAGEEQTLDVQIDAQVLWVRKGGRLTQI